MLTLDDPERTLKTVTRILDAARTAHAALVEHYHVEPTLKELQEYIEHLKGERQVHEEDAEAFEEDDSEKLAEEHREEAERYDTRIRNLKRAERTLRRYGYEDHDEIAEVKQTVKSDRRRLHGYVKTRGGKVVER